MSPKEEKANLPALVARAAFLTGALVVLPAAAAHAEDPTPVATPEPTPAQTTGTQSGTQDFGPATIQAVSSSSDNSTAIIPTSTEPSTPPPPPTNAELIQQAQQTITNATVALADTVTTSQALPTEAPVTTTTAISVAQNALQDAQAAITSATTAVQNVDTAQVAVTSATQTVQDVTDNQLIPAQENLASASAAVAAQETVVATAQVNADNAQTALSSATSAVTTQQAVVTTAEANLTGAQTALSTAQAASNTTVTETFTNNTISTDISITVNGTPVTTTYNSGTYISPGWNSGDGVVSGSALVLQSPSVPVVINLPDSKTVTEVGFGVYAKNGDSYGTVTYTDATTSTFTIENDVDSQHPHYTHSEVVVAPTNKSIDKITLATDWDYYIIDNLYYKANSGTVDPALTAAVTSAQQTVVTETNTLTTLQTQLTQAQTTATTTQQTLTTETNTLNTLTVAEASATQAVATAQASVSAAQQVVQQATTALVQAQAVADNAVANMQEKVTLAVQATTIADIHVDIDVAQHNVDVQETTAQSNGTSVQAAPVIAAAHAAVDAARVVAVAASSALDNAISLNNSISSVDVIQSVVDANTSAVTAASTAVTTAQAEYSAAQTAVADAQAVIDANTTTGIEAKVYNNAGYNSAPPLPGDNRLITTTTVNQINFNWGSGQVLNTYSEDIAVKFTSQLTAPITGTIQFYAPADDGTILQLDGNTVINDWRDKGGGGSINSYNVIAGDPMDMTFWFYENGGGANVNLMWNLGNGWVTIPSNAFTRTQATLQQVTNLTNAQNALTIETQQLAQATSGLTSAQSSLAASQQLLQAAADADASIQTSLAAIAAATNAINATDTIVSQIPAGIHENLTPEIIATAVSNGSITVTVTPPPATEANTWFYQVIAEDPNAANPYANGTWNTDGAPTTFTISGLSNGVAYLVRVAHWNGTVSQYDEVTATPVLPQTPTVVVPDTSPDPVQTSPSEPTPVDPPVETPPTEPEVPTEPSVPEEPTLPTEPTPTPEEPATEPEVPATTPEEPTTTPTEEPQTPSEEPTPSEPPVTPSKPDPTPTETKSEPTSLKDALADGKVTTKEATALVEKITGGDTSNLSSAERAAVATVLVAAYASNGGAVPASVIAASGIEYKDLPPETPVDVRTDESGNAVVITAEVAADIALVTDPGALAEALFTDPGAALAALGSLGADMSPQEREESQKVVVTSVIVTGIAVQSAVSAAAAATSSSSRSSSSSPSPRSSGNGDAGLPSGRENGTTRRRKPTPKSKKPVKKLGRIRRLRRLK